MGCKPKGKGFVLGTNVWIGMSVDLIIMKQHVQMDLLGEGNGFTGPTMDWHVRKPDIFVGLPVSNNVFEYLDRLRGIREKEGIERL
jgi:hypothetical protein